MWVKCFLIIRNIATYKLLQRSSNSRMPVKCFLLLSLVCDNCSCKLLIIFLMFIQAWDQTQHSGFQNRNHGQANFTSDRLRSKTSHIILFQNKLKSKRVELQVAAGMTDLLTDRCYSAWVFRWIDFFYCLIFSTEIKYTERHALPHLDLDSADCFYPTHFTHQTK